MVTWMSICVKVIELYSDNHGTLLNVSYSSIGKIRLQGELQNEEYAGPGQLQVEACGSLCLHVSAPFIQPSCRTLAGNWPPGSRISDNQMSSPLAGE